MIQIDKIKSSGDGQMEVCFSAWATVYKEGDKYECCFEFEGSYFNDYNSDKKEIEEKLRQLIKENI